MVREGSTHSALHWNRMPDTQPTALVTGASSGIGEVFSRRLARDGYRLILVARRQERLDRLAAKSRAHRTLAADLTYSDDLALVEARIASEPRLELLVNNAGFGTKGLLLGNALRSAGAMHLLHVMATMRLTRAALAAMVPRARGSCDQRVLGGGLRAESQQCQLLRHQGVDEQLHRGPGPGIPRYAARRCACRHFAPASPLPNSTTPWA